MEDAHFAVTQPECGEGQRYSFFGVFDGHGGREVAKFCEKHFPAFFSQKLKQLQTERASPEEKGISLEVASEALSQTFCAMDVVLEDPEYNRELLALKSKKGGRGAPVAEAKTALQADLDAQIDCAREKGNLTKDEAMRILRGQMMLQKLQDITKASDPSTRSQAWMVGCTAVAVFLTDTHVICANAGDSRALLSRGGKVVALSHDHKPNDPEEKKRILNAGATIKEVIVVPDSGTRIWNKKKKIVHHRINGDLNLSRSIGDLRHKNVEGVKQDEQAVIPNPDFHIEKRHPDDEFIVLACDGVWDVLSNEQVGHVIREAIRNGLPLGKVLEDLLDSCLCTDPKKSHGIGADNMTITVVKILGATVAETCEDEVTATHFFPFACGSCLRVRR